MSGHFSETYLSLSMTRDLNMVFDGSSPLGEESERERVEREREEGGERESV